MTGILVVALALVLGYRVARVVDGEDDPLTLLALTPALAIAILLLLLNWTWPWLAASSSPPSMLAGVILGLGLLGKRRLNAPLRPQKVQPAILGALVLLGAAALWFALALQSLSMVVEGDFFVHIANIGLFSNGHFPPLSPVSGVPMHGHYGRDLLISGLSELLHANCLTVEWIFTCLVQMVSLLLLFVWIRKESKSEFQAFFATFFFFTAANLGTQAGAIDSISNNNPTAILFLLLVGWSGTAFLRALEDGRSTLAIGLTTALLLGADSVVYEVHYGVMLLSFCVLLAAGPYLATSTISLSRRWGQGILLAIASVVVAATLGGTVGDAVRRVAAGHSQGQVDAAQQLIEQKVSISLKTRTLLSYPTDNLRPSLAFDTKFRPWPVTVAPRAALLPLWDGWILSTFWYPVWLLPFTAGYLIRKRDRLGLLFTSLALISLAIPGVFEFGAFANESARWFYVTALGAAACLGLVCGRARTRVAWVAVAVVVFFCSPAPRLRADRLQVAFANPGVSTPQGQPGPISSSIVPDPLASLEKHYRLGADEREACQWLRTHADRNERFLSDDYDQDWNPKGTRIGWMGIFPAGYYSSSVQLGAYPMGPNGRLYWETGDARYAQAIGARWIYRTDNHHLVLDPLAFETPTVRVYRLPDSSPVDAWGEPPLLFVNTTAPVRVNAFVRLACTGEATAPFWMRCGAQPPMLGIVMSGQLPIWTPPATGSFPLEVSATPSGPWREIGKLEVR